MSMKIKAIGFTPNQFSALQSSFKSERSHALHTFENGGELTSSVERVADLINENPDGLVIRNHIDFEPFEGLRISEELRELGYKGYIRILSYELAPQRRDGHDSEKEELNEAQRKGIINSWGEEHGIYRDSGSLRLTEMAMAIQAKQLREAQEKSGSVVIVYNRPSTHMGLHAALQDHAKLHYDVELLHEDKTKVKSARLSGADVVVFESSADGRAVIAKAKALRNAGYKGKVLVLSGDDIVMGALEKRHIADAINAGIVDHTIPLSHLKRDVLPFVTMVDDLMRARVAEPHADVGDITAVVGVVSPVGHECADTKKLLAGEAKRGCHYEVADAEALTPAFAANKDVLVVHLAQSDAMAIQQMDAIVAVRKAGFTGKILVIEQHPQDMDAPKSAERKGRAGALVKDGVTDEMVMPLKGRQSQLVTDAVARLAWSRQIEKDRAAGLVEWGLEGRMEKLERTEREWPEALQLSHAQLKEIERKVLAAAHKKMVPGDTPLPAFAYPVFAKEMEAVLAAALEKALREKDGRWDKAAKAPRAMTQAERELAAKEAKDRNAFRKQALAELEYRYYEKMSLKLADIDAEWKPEIRSAPKRVYSAADRQRYPGIESERTVMRRVKRDEAFPYAQQIAVGNVLDFHKGMGDAMKAVAESGVQFGGQQDYNTAVNRELAKRIVGMLAAVKRLEGDASNPAMEVQVLKVLEGQGGHLPMRLTPTHEERLLREGEQKDMKEQDNRQSPEMVERWQASAAAKLGIAMPQGRRR